MTSRRAILIESSTLSGHAPLAGARADVVNLQSFLLEDCAGAWEADEIVVLHNPQLSDLQNVLRTAGARDYTFLAFSGHGYHVRGRGLEEDRICLSNGEEMPVSALNSGSPRFACVIDTCRKIEEAQLLVEAEGFTKAAKADETYYRQQCRLLFDTLVGQCERGSIYLFSCDLEEAAGETREGGYFTTSLINSCRVWAGRTSKGSSASFNLYEAFKRSAALVTRTSPQQHPQFQGGRRLHYFPLMVRP